MWKSHRFRAALFTVSIAALCPHASQAQSDTLGRTQIVGIEGGALTVASNGRAYTQLVGPREIEVTTLLELRMNPPHAIVSWLRSTSIRYGSERDFVPSTTARGDPHRMIYPEDDRPSFLQERLVTTFDTRSLAGPAVEQCNARVEALRRQGRTDAWIFGQERTASLMLRPEASFETTTSGGLRRAERGRDRVLGVRCLPFRGSRPADAPPSPSEDLVVRSASLEAAPIQRPGEPCRIAVQLAIRTNQPGATVEYKIGTERGTESRVFAVQADGYGTATASHSLAAQTQSGRNAGYFYLKPAGDTPLFSANKARYEFTCQEPSALTKPTRKPRGIQLPVDPKRLPLN